MNTSKKMYGWFSYKAHTMSNNIITYITPLNKKVIISNVTDSSTDSGMEWDDVIYLGEVSKFVSNKPKYV